MVKLCLWPYMVLLCKLLIYCDYIWYILHKTNFYVLGLWKREKMYKTHCNPLQKSSVAVFIFLWVDSRGPISCLSQKNPRTPQRNDCSNKKGSLRKDIPSVGTLVGLLVAVTWQAASALLGLASLPSTSWCGLCQRPAWSPYWLGACACVPGNQSWSLQGRGPNSAASSTSGSL